MLKDDNASEVAIKVMRADTNVEHAIHRQISLDVAERHISPCVVFTGSPSTCHANALRPFLPPETQTLLQDDTEYITFPMEKARGTLLEYIIRNRPTLAWYRLIFFKILYTLHALHLQYQVFRHNDLHLENILLVHGPSIMPELFSVGERHYKLPASLHIPCIADYGHAQLNAYPAPEQRDNTDLPGVFVVGQTPLWTRDYYHDILGLMNNLLLVAREHQLTPATRGIAVCSQISPQSLSVAARAADCQPANIRCGHFTNATTILILYHIFSLPIPYLNLFGTTAM